MGKLEAAGAWPFECPFVVGEASCWPVTPLVRGVGPLPSPFEGPLVCAVPCICAKSRLCDEFTSCAWLRSFFRSCGDPTGLCWSMINLPGISSPLAVAPALPRDSLLPPPPPPASRLLATPCSSSCPALPRSPPLACAIVADCSLPTCGSFLS